MIGLIKLTGVDDMPYYINPQCITFFTPSAPAICAVLTGDERIARQGCSVIVINGMPLQVKDSPQDIARALTTLRKKLEDNLLELKKRVDRPDWMDDEDEDLEEGLE